MQEGPSIRIASELPESTSVIDVAESFLAKYPNPSKLNGDRNSVTREAIDILCKLENTVEENGSILREEDLSRIIQLLSGFEEFQAFNADITKYIIKIIGEVETCKKRMETKKVLSIGLQKWTPKNLSIVASELESRIKNHGFENGVAISTSNMLKLLLDFISENNLIQLNDDQKSDIKKVIGFISSLLESREFHKLASSEAGIRLRLEDMIFRIKMDLLLKGEWGYFMNK